MYASHWCRIWLALSPVHQILALVGAFGSLALLTGPLRADEPTAAPFREAAELLTQPGGTSAWLKQLGVVSYRDLSYVEGGHERQRLDLHLPAKTRGQRLPVIVFIHGGGWRTGRKSSGPTLPLLARGFAIASIGYRLSVDAPFPAQIHDAKAAIRWLRAQADQYGLDPERIAVLGQSAGAHLASLLGTSGDVAQLEGDLGNAEESSRVQAVIDAYGPTDFFLGDIGGRIDRPDGAVARLLGGPPSEKQALARMASPVHWISPDDAPTLILHGTLDRTVPPEQSRTFAERLEAAGVVVERLEFPGAAHGGAEFKSPETLEKIAAFLEEHLQARTAPPSPEGSPQRK